MPRIRIWLYLGTIALLLTLATAWYVYAFLQDSANSDTLFDGARAYSDVERQVGFGPRIPGSEAHAKTLDWMESELSAAGWTVQRQTATSLGHALINVIAYRSTEAPQILVGAHYDSRLHSDRDSNPAFHTFPTPGANDGASGVAVLLELARSLPADSLPIWLVFFDAEDNGRIPGWDWTLGSRAFVDQMTLRPEKMVLVDMVGDRDLQLPMEKLSDPDLRASIWATAARLGHEDVFVPQAQTAILDDHVPFLDAGIPAVDIIDISYEFWHTTEDTPDKVSVESLQLVGDVLWTWLLEQQAVDG